MIKEAKALPSMVRLYGCFSLELACVHRAQEPEPACTIFTCHSEGMFLNIQGMRR